MFSALDTVRVSFSLLLPPSMYYQDAINAEPQQDAPQFLRSLTLEIERRRGISITHVIDLGPYPPSHCTIIFPGNPWRRREGSGYSAGDS